MISRVVDGRIRITTIVSYPDPPTKKSRKGLDKPVKRPRRGGMFDVIQLLPDWCTKKAEINIPIGHVACAVQVVDVSVSRVNKGFRLWLLRRALIATTTEVGSLCPRRASKSIGRY